MVAIGNELSLSLPRLTEAPPNKAQPKLRVEPRDHTHDESESPREALANESKPTDVKSSRESLTRLDEMIKMQEELSKVSDERATEAREARKHHTAADSADARGMLDPHAHLTREELAKVRAMQRRDEEVRRHEMAHKRAGGQYAGPITYEYRRGPDGEMYVTGGRVTIHITPSASPEATARKMDAIRKAALAPANPSGSDRMVAAIARRMKYEAEKQIQAEEAAEMEQQKKSRSKEMNEIRETAINSVTASPLAMTQATNAYGAMKSITDERAAEQKAVFA